MKDISLRALLEAGCHFGHKSERWHPKASKFIFQARDGLHIIDLAQTRDNLKKAAEFVKELGVNGKILLMVATKRQAKGVVTEAAKRAGVPYLTNRWIGGFVTNWESVKKNIDRLNRGFKEQQDGSWQKFPKHEIIKLGKHLHKQEVVYGGVAMLETLPDAVFIVDIKKEISCLREAFKRGIPAIAIVDTNTDPTLVDYPVPANDDAVGSIQFVVNFLADAYIEGKKLRERGLEKEGQKEKAGDKSESEAVKVTNEEKKDEQKKEIKKEPKKSLKKIGKTEKKKHADIKGEIKKELPKKKRGRPKKVKI